MGWWESAEAHRGVGCTQGPSGLGSLGLTLSRDGRVPIVSSREECVEAGLVSLLHEAVLGTACLLDPIITALEYHTYHFCKARLLDLQDKIQLSTTTP